MSLKILTIVIFGLTYSNAIKSIENNLVDEEPESYRLPGESIPSNYLLHISTKIHEKDFQYTGTVEIHIQIIKRTNSLRLHNRQLNIESVVIIENDKNLVKSFSSKDLYDFLDIDLEDFLENNDKIYKLVIKFNAPLREVSQGFYRSYYLDDNNSEHWLGATHFEPTHARYAFPCYDEPGLKAKFDLKIQHHQSYTAVSNMPGIRETVNNEYVLTTFEKTPMMSTYLLAFVVSNFVGKETVGITPIQHIFSRPNAVNNSQFGLDEGVSVLKALEDYIGLPYSLSKLDQIAVPDFQGAMENWGLVIYSETLLLFKKDTGNLKQKKDITTTISHEYAHQFFGNYVSPKWWDVIWLNEGFATLFEFHISNLINLNLRLLDFFVVDVIHPVMVQDAFESTRALTSNAETPLGISSLFDNIAYFKGGSFLRMVQHFLSDNVFSKGLNYYLKSVEYRIASDIDLYAGLQKSILESNGLSSEYNINDILNSWTLQKGFPLLTVNCNYANQTVVLSQQRFQYQKNSSENTLWWIPFNFIKQNDQLIEFENTLPIGWIPKITSVQLSIENLKRAEWILFNKQQTGYYRVNYDDNNWILLTNFLKDKRNINTIHPTNRAQLIDDSFNIARAGILDYSIPLNLALYLKEEIDYIPWVAAETNLKYLHRRFIGTQYQTVFEIYLNELISSLYNNVGEKNFESSTHMEIFTRSLAVKWYCLLENQKCVKMAENILNEYFETNLIDPNLKEQIFCYGIQNANWTTLLNHLLQSNDQADRIIILEALGCVKNQTELHNILLTTISDDVTLNYRRSERNRLFNAVLTKTPQGLIISMEFLGKYYKEIQELYSGNKTLQTFVSSIAGYITNQDQADSFKLKVLDKLENIVDGSIIKSAESVIKETLEWQESFGPKINNWLSEYYKSSSGLLLCSFKLIIFLHLLVYIFKKIAL